MTQPIVLFFKAYQPDLFDAMVPVKGFTRKDGVTVKPHTAKRSKKTSNKDLTHRPGGPTVLFAGRGKSPAQSPGDNSMKLQYSAYASSGRFWIDISQERVDEFLARAVERHGHTKEQITQDGLLAGKEVAINQEGFATTYIRDYNSIKRGDNGAAESIQAAPAKPALTCRECGQTGHSGKYPFSTLGGDVCDDCL